MNNNNDKSTRKRNRNWNNNNNSTRHNAKRAKINKRITFKNKNNVKVFESNNYNRKPISINRSNKENMPSYRVNIKAAIEKIKEIKTHRNNVEKMLGVPLKSKKKT
jgi:hypothetical protein